MGRPLMSQRLTFLEATHRILSEAGRPMTAAEILYEARAQGVLFSEGKTPVKTLNARLAVDILRYKSESRFMRADGSRYALREWSDVQERIVPRRTVALVDEDVLVFEASLLRRFISENGF